MSPPTTTPPGDTRPSPLWTWILTSDVANKEIWPLLAAKGALRRTSLAARAAVDARVLRLRVTDHAPMLVAAAGRFKSLSSLDLCCWDAAAAAPALPALGQLAVLSIQGSPSCRLSDAGAADAARHITALQRLQRLQVNAHKLSDEGCAALLRAAARLPQLRALDLSGGLTGDGCAAAIAEGAWAEVTELALGHVSLSAAQALAGATLPLLTSLSVSGPSQSPAPGAANALLAAPWARALKKLAITDRVLTDTSALKDSCLDILEELNLNKNGYLGTESGLAGLVAASLPLLKRLSLCSIDLSESGIKSLDGAAWAPQLRMLDLRQWVDRDSGDADEDDAEWLSDLNYALDASPALLALESEGRLAEDFQALEGVCLGRGGWSEEQDYYDSSDSSDFSDGGDGGNGGCGDPCCHHCIIHSRHRY